MQLDPERLAAHQLTVQDVVATIQQNNVDIPSGRIERRQREFLVQTQGQFRAAEPINDLIVAVREGGPVRIRDVGAARDGVENDRQTARFRRQTAVGLGVVKQSDANTVALARAVRQRMAELARAFWGHIEFRSPRGGHDGGQAARSRIAESSVASRPIHGGRPPGFLRRVLTRGAVFAPGQRTDIRPFC